MKLFLDMDEVLVDFVGGLHRKFNKPFDPDNWPYTLGRDGYMFFADMGITREEANEKCDYLFFASLHWTSYGKELLRLLEDQFKQEDIFLLTRPMGHPGSVAGKVAWAREHLPRYEQQTIITTANKSLLAAPDRLLIDDCDDNVEQWRNACCAPAIVVPCWWNHAHWYRNNPISFVAKGLKAVLAEASLSDCA